MKVLVVGYTKTGTKTVDLALETLGFKVSPSLRCQLYLSQKWTLYFDGKASLIDLKEMYEGYDATSDMPAFYFWRDFLKIYPNLKLILLERDEESFLRSWKSHKNRSDKDFSIPFFFSRTAKNFVNFWHICMKQMIPHPAPTSSFFKRCPHYDDEVILKSYRDHNKDVIENAPRGRLLRFKVQEGWEPLCAFLEKDVPKIPFPHVNKGGNVNNLYYGRLVKEISLTIFVYILLLVAGIFLVRYLL